MEREELEKKSTEELLNMLDEKSMYIGQVELLETIKEDLDEYPSDFVSYKEGEGDNEYRFYIKGKHFITYRLPFSSMVKMVIEIIEDSYNRGRTDISDILIKKVQK